MKLDEELGAEEKHETVDKYGRRAVELLKRAIELGFQGTDKLKTEADLESLRSRDDFKDLVQSLSNDPE